MSVRFLTIPSNIGHRTGRSPKNAGTLEKTGDRVRFFYLAGRSPRTRHPLY